MRGVLLLNGEPYSGDIDGKNALVYCCDGAYKWAKDLVKIDENIGDFDSLDTLPEPLPERIYPSEKDFTDGELALFKLLEKGVDSVEIYGGGGGRSDHFLGNLHLLFAAFSRGVPAVMFNNGERLFLANGKCDLGEYLGQTVSVLPFCGEAHIIGSRGLKYPEPEILRYGSCVGISNVVESRDAYIKVGEGQVLVIVNGGKV